MATMRENASIVISAARQMRAIIELAEQIGDIETVEAQLAAKVSEHNALLGKLMDAKKGLADAEKDTAAAKEEAAKLRKDATAYAKASKEKADLAAKAALEATGPEIQKAQDELGSYRPKILAAQDTLAGLEKDISGAQAKLDALQKAYDALKAKING